MRSCIGKFGFLASIPNSLAKLFNFCSPKVPQIPAVCPNCGQKFPSGIALEGPSQVQIQNVGSGPCPNCGSMGRIPDGMHAVIDGVLRFVQAEGRTSEELEAMAEALRQINVDQSTTSLRDDLRHVLRKHNFPESVLGLSLHRLSWTEVWSVIHKVAAVLTIVGAFFGCDKIGIHVGDVINVYRESTRASMDSSHTTRNDSVEVTPDSIRCPCGSGRSFSSCHGRQ